MGKTEKLIIYSDYIEDLDIAKKDLAKQMGVSAKMLGNYLSGENEMPVKREAFFIDYINNVIDEKNSKLPKLSQNLLIEHDYMKGRFVNLDIDELKKRDLILQDIKNLQRKYSISLVELTIEDNFELLRIAFDKPYFRIFLSKLTDLFKEKRGLDYTINEIDVSYIEELLSNKKLTTNDIAKKLRETFKKEDMYGEEINNKLKKIDLAIKDTCKTFLNNLYEDYCKSKDTNSKS